MVHEWISISLFSKKCKNFHKYGFNRISCENIYNYINREGCDSIAVNSIEERNKGDIPITILMKKEN